MSKKITQEEFLKRFSNNYPDADITLIDYTAISNKLTAKCNKCGKEFHYSRAREILSNFSCCGRGNETKIKKLIRLYDGSEDFDFVKQVDKDHYIVHHKTCGNDLKRVIQNSLDNPFACTYCNSIKKQNMLSIEEVQQRIDERFFGVIQILDYNGQLETNHYKCLKCGRIFTQKQVCLMQSRGCPVCDRYKSHGERQIEELLKARGVRYETQMPVEDLPL